MKKLYFTLVILMTIGIGSANAQIAWGVRAGASRVTYNATASGGGSSASVSENGAFGFEAGPVLYYSLKKNFYLNSGVLAKIIPDDELYYIDVPVYAGYNINLGGKVSPYVQVGPYAGFNLSGDGANTMNFGVAAMAGVNLNRFKVEVGYQKGLINVLSVYESGYSVELKLNSLFLGVSYVF